MHILTQSVLAGFQEDYYVLPLRWCGLPVRMSCPVVRQSTNPPMVTCYAGGMMINTEWAISVSKIKVNGKCVLFHVF